MKMMMILSSLMVVLCLVVPTRSAPATIVSGFGMDEILKEAQVQHDKMGMKSVDSSPEVGGSPMVDGSTEAEKSHEKSTSHHKSASQESSHESHHVETVHLEPTDEVVMGREHIHDPEHGNDDVVIDDHHKMHKVTTQVFGAGDGDVEIGGNSESPKPAHHHHHQHFTENSQHRSYNPVEITSDQQDFKKGYAPTEIVWSPSVMSNGYNGGVRRPEYRHAVYFVQRH